MLQHIDLNTGFVLMIFDEYAELIRVKELCLKKHKEVMYSGDPGKVKEIQVKRWCRGVQIGFQDYARSIDDYYNLGKTSIISDGVKSGVESLRTAINVLEEKTGAKARFILIAKK
jgi:hypothetical protein